MSKEVITKNQKKRLTADELDVLTRMLGLSDNRISERQKECLKHLLIQYTMMLDNLREENLKQMYFAGGEL